jgi:acyl-CoA dehydrogenase
VAHFQSISFTLAEMAMDVDSARWMVWRAAVDLEKGHDRASTTVAKAAVHANDVAWRVADNAVQLLGGAGYIQDYPAEKWMRDTKALALIGGADQLGQLIVAGAELGRSEEFGAGLPAPWIQPVVT